MISYSIIQKSQLEGGLRLDAEYYQPEYLEISKKLETAPRVADLVSDIRYGLYVEPEYKKNGVDFIRALNLLNFWIGSEILKIDANKVPKSYHLKTADSLIVRSGANTGSVALVDSRFNDATFGSYTIRLRFNKINPFFAVVFLNTRYGVLQTQRLQTGMAQPNLNIPNIKEIRIPLVSEEKQKEIEELCLEIEKERERSEIFYTQAENLLLEELGLKDFKVEDDLSYIINLSDVKSAHRADAEYFQPKYEKLISKIKNQNAKRLKEVAKGVKTKIKPKPEEVYKYIEISDIGAGSGDVSFNEIIGKELPANARIIIKGGELIVSKVRPTRGAISIIPNDFNYRFICSGAFSVFQAQEILKEYLFVALRSIIGRLQFEKPTTGTSYPTITDEDVENTLIPILSKPTQQKIADLVQKSHEARKKAKQLLEQAKQKVENLIGVKS